MLSGTRWLATFAIFVIAGLPVHAEEYAWDQSNDSFIPLLTQNASIYSPIGQEFVPNLTYLDVVQLWIQDMKIGSTQPADFIVNIREGTIRGRILGTSATATLAGGFNGIVTFTFEAVQLVPQTLYVIELVQGSGQGWGVKSSGGGYSTYPRGRQILGGEPQENNDLWFREGRVGTVPVQAVTWGQVKKSYQ